MIDGQRLIVWSGEFHIFRLPSPPLWRDVLEKIRAEGFNTVSLYFSWAYSSPAPGVYDFTGIRDVDRAADDGRAGWAVCDRQAGSLHQRRARRRRLSRLADPSSSAPPAAPRLTTRRRGQITCRRLDPIIARHQITRGGSVIAYQIENELVNTGTETPYMEAIVNQVHKDGIDVPTDRQPRRRAQLAADRRPRRPRHLPAGLQLQAPGRRGAAALACRSTTWRTTRA